MCLVFWSWSLERLIIKKILFLKTLDEVLGFFYFCTLNFILIIPTIKYIFIFSCFFSLQTFATQKEYKISKIEKGPKIDGLENDVCWEKCEIASDFIQTIPKPQEAATYRTEVKVCYSNTSIFLFAKLVQPKNSIKKQLCPRDEIERSNADVFTFIIDPYNDKQNGYAFKVTAAGAIEDRRLVNGTQNGDVSWDAVWNAKVVIYDNYWTVEMEIPFNAIRFPVNSNQAWGMQFARKNRKENEDSYWSRYDVLQNGFLNQAGSLIGIEQIEAPLRLSFFPYLSTGIQVMPNGKSKEATWLKSGGMDIKYGINDAFTLDVTLIPDFSQVISDNVIRNVSPFEQQLTENRPFFTEGLELFNKQGLFYSRRVGRRPNKYYEIEEKYGDTSTFEILKNPNISSLYNAFKISGRNKNNIGIGVFNALSQEMFATIYDRVKNEKFKVSTEPMSNYNVLVFDKTLKGQSYINFTNTNVIRGNSSNVANVSSIQSQLYDRRESHRIGFFAAKSIISNQKSGERIALSYEKISGKLTYEFSSFYISPNYSQNDLGIQFDYNHSSTSVNFSYQENKPQKLQLYRLSLNQNIQFNAKPFVFKRHEISLDYFMLFKNFWDVTLNISYTPFPIIDFYQLNRFNKRIEQFNYIYTGVFGSSDSRKKFYWGFELGRGISFKNSKATYVNFAQEYRYRFNNHFELKLRFDLENDHSNVGYVYSDMLNVPVVAMRNIDELSSEISFKYNINPNLNFTGRWRFYNTKIKNQSFHHVNEKGAWAFNSLPYSNQFDENFNLQNIDVFFNWIYKPGSRFVLSYKQWLQDAYILNNKKENTYFDNAYQIIKTPKPFEINMRWVYYLNYSDIKK